MVFGKDGREEDDGRRADKTKGINVRKGAKSAESKSPREKQETYEKAWREFVAALRERGDRVTHARQIVFTCIMERHDHFRADDLAIELARGPDRVSRGTVYRALALMENVGFVRTVRDADTRRFYEHTYGHGHHDHMICEICGGFIEFSDAAFHRTLEKNCRRHGFRPASHRIVVFGTCAKCRKKEKS